MLVQMIISYDDGPSCYHGVEGSKFGITLENVSENGKAKYRLRRTFGRHKVCEFM